MSVQLSDALHRAFSEAGFTSFTPVQELALPALLMDGDVAVEAPTGSGKTLTFVIPLLARFLEHPGAPGAPKALILTPTRELALQIARSIKQIARSLDEQPTVVTLIGGERLHAQRVAVQRGSDVVVATPGRLVDLLEREDLDLGEVATLVLDEADRLLDGAFGPCLEALTAHLPTDRDTWLFSATLPGKVLARARPLLSEPTVLRVTDRALPVDTVTQRVFAVPPSRRRLLLQHLLAEEDWGPTLVFVARRFDAEKLQFKLARDGFGADLLHGRLAQDERSDVVRRFAAGDFRVLVVTDLASRGLDLPELDVVVNFDLPRSPRDYLHRVGRAGRAGRQGRAVSFVCHATEPHLRLIEKRNGVRLPRLSIPGFEQKGPPPPPSKGVGGVKGRRKSKKDKLREQRARDAQEG